MDSCVHKDCTPAGLASLGEAFLPKWKETSCGVGVLRQDAGRSSRPHFADSLGPGTASQKALAAGVALHRSRTGCTKASSRP